MAAYFKQSCPLCATAADYYLVDAENRKYFNCPKCSYFQISRRAEQILAKSSKSRRDFYTGEAQRAPEGLILVIRMPEHEYLQQHLSDPLQATFVAKSALPLA